MIATDYLIEYIKSVGKNSLNSKHIQEPILIDLVISGGAFNFSYGYGSILYLKELQRQHKIKINKASGCSSGSMLALLALSENFNEFDIDSIYVQLHNHFRENGNLGILKDKIHEIVYKCIKTDEEAVLLSDRLFISTTDMSICNHKVINTYKSRADIVDAIVSSSYIPFMIDGNTRYNTSFIDGIVPHIFKHDTSHIIYINLMNKMKILNILITNGEINAQYRVIEGVVETVKFINEGKSSICSWLNDWNFIDFLMFRLCHLVMILFTLFIDVIRNIQIPRVLQNNVLYKSIQQFSYHLINDYVFRCCAVIL